MCRGVDRRTPRTTAFDERVTPGRDGYGADESFIGRIDGSRT
jgi:hypothetical protein